MTPIIDCWGLDQNVGCASVPRSVEVTGRVDVPAQQCIAMIDRDQHDSDHDAVAERAAHHGPRNRELEGCWDDGWVRQDRGSNRNAAMPLGTGS